MSINDLKKEILNPLREQAERDSLRKNLAKDLPKTEISKKSPVPVQKQKPPKISKSVASLLGEPKKSKNASAREAYEKRLSKLKKKK